MGRFVNTAVRAAGVAGAVAGSVLVAPQAASAAPGVTAAAVPAPTCVRIDRSSYFGAFWKYTATNNCSTQQRVKLIFRYAGDTGCWILDRGESEWDFRGKGIPFDGAVRC